MRKPDSTKKSCTPTQPASIAAATARPTIPDGSGVTIARWAMTSRMARPRSASSTGMLPRKVRSSASGASVAVAAGVISGSSAAGRGAPPATGSRAGGSMSV